MDGTWWQLPGPSRFVQGLVSDLRDGQNVVLVLPDHAPLGLRDTLAARVRDNDLWRWRVTDSSEFPVNNSADLVDALRCRFAVNSDRWGYSSVDQLAGELSGTIIWIENIDDMMWPIWSQFLAEFQHGCSARAEHDRGLFCVPLTSAVHPLPLPDIALRIRRWEGVVDRLDMALYLNRAFAQRFDQPLHHKVAVAMAVELAGSDAELACSLAHEDLKTLCNPIDFLIDFAAQRGWRGNSVSGPNWQAGSCDIIEGVSTPHSAAIAALGQYAEVFHRIWRGQVAILFPFIEELRLQVAPEVRGLLTFPIETTYGRVECVEDLEVGQLVHFLRGKNVPRRLWRLLNVLRDMRHTLAHMGTVAYATLCENELVHNE